MTPSWRHRARVVWWKVRFPIWLFVFTRAALVALSWLGMKADPSFETQGGPRHLLRPYPALDGFFRWDTPFFLRIAEEGYWEKSATNFFPLFPLTARAVHELSGIPTIWCLLIVANIFCLLAFIVLYRVFRMLSDEESARWALGLFAANPFNFYSSAAYPESETIFFTALAVYFALKNRHFAAATALGFGVLSRHLAMFAGAALLIIQIRQRWGSWKRVVWSPSVLALAIPWLALAGYCLYQQQRFGDPLAFWHARDNWGPRAYWGLGELLASTEQDVPRIIMLGYLPFAAFATIGALGLFTRRAWWDLSGFALVMMGSLWVVGMYGLGRYTASCWPVFLPLGAFLATRPTLQIPLTVVLALAQGVFFFLFSHQFPVL